MQSHVVGLFLWCRACDALPEPITLWRPAPPPNRQFLTPAIIDASEINYSFSFLVNCSAKERTISSDTQNQNQGQAQSQWRPSWVSLFARQKIEMRRFCPKPKSNAEDRRTHPTRKLLVSMRKRHRGGICVQRNITAFSLSAAGKLCKLPMIGDRALARAHIQIQTQVDSRYSMETAMCKLDVKQIDRIGEIRSKMCAQKPCFAARRMLNNGTNGNYRQPRQDWTRFTSSGFGSSIDAATIVLSTKTNFCVDTHLIESQPIVLKVSGFLE